MSTFRVDYFLRRRGLLGSSTAGVLAGASPNAGVALPNSTADGGVGSACVAGAGATGAVYTGVGCGTSGEGVIHCGCAGTLTSGAVPTPEIFPLLSPRSFLYHV